jgi:hypothetical protein
VQSPAPSRRTGCRVASAAALLLGIGGALCLAQSSGLPATQPTESPAAAVSPSAPTAKPSAAANAAHQPKVTYEGGRLAVTADNSSLNQVLREIARKTGMTITGGVSEERVFGTYGPAPPAKVLASLLDGTGSNMLLREDSKDAPAELILTPRLGGPTPPNPNAPGYDDDATSSDQAGASSNFPGWATPAAGPPDATSAGGSPGGVASGSSNATPGAAMAPGASGTDAQSPAADMPQSPNGVKTPAQIYQQLQQLQQQQQSHP